MGGSASIGNVTAVAEFNVWQDPEAATCVSHRSRPRCTAWTSSPAWPPIRHRRSVRLGGPGHHGGGELLYRRSARSDRPGHAYVGLIGDAGALVYLTDPEMFSTGTFRSGSI